MCYNIRVAHKPTATLRHLLTNVKDRDEPNTRQGAVYKIKCYDCQAIYIFETRRNLNTRLTELILLGSNHLARYNSARLPFAVNVMFIASLYHNDGNVKTLAVNVVKDKKRLHAQEFEDACAASFLWLGLPSTLIRRVNAGAVFRNAL